MTLTDLQTIPYRQFVQNYNIFNFDIENETNLNKAHNFLKKELNATNALFNMFVGRLCIKWSPFITYEIGEIVSYYNETPNNNRETYYVALKTNSDETPPNSESWVKISTAELFENFDLSKLANFYNENDWTLKNNLTVLNQGHFKKLYFEANEGNISSPIKKKNINLNLNNAVVAGVYVIDSEINVTNIPEKITSSLSASLVVTYASKQNPSSNNSIGIFVDFYNLTHSDLLNEVKLNNGIGTTIIQTITYTNLNEYRRFGTYNISKNSVSWSNWEKIYLKDYIDTEIARVSALTSNLDATLAEKLKSYISYDNNKQMSLNGDKITAIKTTKNGLLPPSNNTTNIGASGNVFKAVYATDFIGTASKAKYADLAEYYDLGKCDCDVGDVIGVTNDGIFRKFEKGDKLIGVVSDKPSYLMNSECENGTAIVLKGLVEVKINKSNIIRKGLYVLADSNGQAKTQNQITDFKDFLNLIGIIVEIKQGKVLVKI